MLIHTNVMKMDNDYRFSYFSSLTKQTVYARTWQGLLLLSADGERALFPDTRAKDIIWWLDIRDATKEEVQMLSQVLDIHPLTTEDVISRETHEKVEAFRDYYLVSFQTLVHGDESPAGVYILVFRHGVVTFSPSGCGHVRRVRDRIRRMHDPSVLSGDWISYALMYASPWDFFFISLVADRLSQR